MEDVKVELQNFEIKLSLLQSQAAGGIEEKMRLKHQTNEGLAKDIRELGDELLEVKGQCEQALKDIHKIEGQIAKEAS